MAITNKFLFQIARDIVRETGGLESLVAIIKDKSIRENKQLLAAATGAVWMCAKTNANVKRLDQVILEFKILMICN